MNEFEKTGYIIIPNFVDVKKWHKIAKILEPVCIILQDSPLSPAMWNSPLLKPLHKMLKTKLEKIVELKLYTTYQYFRIYKKGAILKPHSDRPACEISITLNLGGTDWKIGIFDNNNKPHEYLLKAGDALIYHGISCTHWRPGKLKKDELIQIFLHYVDKDGINSWCKDDIRR